MKMNSKSIAERKKALIPPTPEEDAEINRQIAADPDTFDTADPKNAKFLKPAKPEDIARVLDIVKRYRGQRGPQKSPTKVRISLRVDPDVLAFFQKSGRGWQGRINATLRKKVEEMLEPEVGSGRFEIRQKKSGQFEMSHQGKSAPIKITRPEREGRKKANK